MTNAATPAQPRHYYSTRELIWHMAECISPDRAQEIADAIEAQARPAVASELRAALERLVEHHDVYNHDTEPGKRLREWPCTDPDIEQARAALAALAPPAAPHNHDGGASCVPSRCPAYAVAGEGEQE